MKLRIDPRTFTATPETSEVAGGGGDVDLRHLPWEDGSFAAIELDDVPDADAWTLSGPALNECRRVLKRNGLIELRTRRMEGRDAQACQKRALGALARLLQNHGFEIVSLDAVEDEGSLLAAVALRCDGPEDVFTDAIAATETHVTLHAPMLDAGDDAACNRALALSLDAHGVKVRVRVVFDVLDGLYCE